MSSLGKVPLGYFVGGLPMTSIRRHVIIFSLVIIFEVYRLVLGGLKTVTSHPKCAINSPSSQTRVYLTPTQREILVWAAFLRRCFATLFLTSLKPNRGTCSSWLHSAPGWGGWRRSCRLAGQTPPAPLPLRQGPAQFGALGLFPNREHQGSPPPQPGPPRRGSPFRCRGFRCRPRGDGGGWRRPAHGRCGGGRLAARLPQGWAPGRAGREGGRRRRRRRWRWGGCEFYFIFRKLSCVSPPQSCIYCLRSGGVVCVGGNIVLKELFFFFSPHDFNLKSPLWPCSAKVARAFRALPCRWGLSWKGAKGALGWMPPLVFW